MALTVDDRLRHAQDRLESLLHVLDQPACFLQLMRELAARLTPVVLQDIGVHAIDAQLRQRVGVEARHPDALPKLRINRMYADILRSEEHTSELQSQSNLVCRLLLEKKKRAAGKQI